MTDPGLQLERTALSWQRTLLALAVTSLAAGRGLAPVIGILGWVIAGLGIAASITAFLLARRRYRYAHEHFASGRTLPTGGLLVAASAAVSLLAGVAALTFVLTH